MDRKEAGGKQREKGGTGRSLKHREWDGKEGEPRKQRGKGRNGQGNLGKDTIREGHRGKREGHIVFSSSSFLRVSVSPKYHLVFRLPRRPP